MLRNYLILSLILSSVFVCRSEYFREKDIYESHEISKCKRDEPCKKNNEATVRECVQKCLNTMQQPCHNNECRGQVEPKCDEKPKKCNLF